MADNEAFERLSNHYKSIIDWKDDEIKKKEKLIGFLAFAVLYGFLWGYFEHRDNNEKIDEFYNYRENIHAILEENQQFEADNLIKQYEQDIWEEKQDMWINTR